MKQIFVVEILTLLSLFFEVKELQYRLIPRPIVSWRPICETSGFCAERVMELWMVKVVNREKNDVKCAR